MNTNGYGGRSLSKVITVFTNDKERPELKLTISGNVDDFATIIPKIVKLEGPADQLIKETVTIIPKEKYPFKILEANVSKKEDIGITLKAVEREKGLEYMLTIENLKKEKGRYFDTVTLKTDSKISPEIKIRVNGMISENIQQNQEGAAKKPAM